MVISGAKTPCTPTCRGLFEIYKLCKDALFTHVSGLFMNATLFSFQQYRVTKQHVPNLLEKVAF